jgi:hypothetical protein
MTENGTVEITAINAIFAKSNPSSPFLQLVLFALEQVQFSTQTQSL